MNFKLKKYLTHKHTNTNTDLKQKELKIKMYVYVQALDYGRLLRIQVEPNELVRSLKAKIDYELGGNQPEDIIDSLNYLGVTLDCSTPLSSYGIRESSLLYMGRSLQYQYPKATQPPQPQQQFQVQPQIVAPQQLAQQQYAPQQLAPQMPGQLPAQLAPQMQQQIPMQPINYQVPQPYQQQPRYW